MYRPLADGGRPGAQVGWIDSAAREMVMGEIAYVSEVRIEREGGPVRHAYLPAEEQPVIYGAHGAVREHYGYPAEEFPEHATTLDHLVAAAAG